MPDGAEQAVVAEHLRLRADLWSRFAAAQSAADFLQPWLALQCQAIRGVNAALLLWSDRPDSFVPAAAWPDANRDLTYLGPVAEQALRERRGIVLGGGGESGSAAGAVAGMASPAFIAYPCVTEDRAFGVLALDLVPRAEPLLQDVLRQIHWGAGWLETLHLRARESDAHRELGRACLAMEGAALVSGEDGLQASLIALVNLLVERLSADRVTIGLERKRNIRLAAISHSAWFDRRAEFVGALENVMEEAFDQGTTVVVPPVPDAPFHVDVAHAEFARSSGAGAICSVVIPGRDRPLGVLTIESRAGEPLGEEVPELAEAVAGLAGPALELRMRLSRPLSGRMPESVAGAWGTLFGPGRPALKLGVGAILAAVVALALLEGTFRVTAKSVVEGVVQRAAVAPYRGFVASAPVRAGETVVEGQVLATLDDRDLRLERVRWASELQQAEQKGREALARRERAAAQILAAQARQAQAQLALVEEKLSRTRIVAPVAGLVVSGDLSQLLGSPLEQGQVLFEIAPLDAYRVILKVDERDIAHVSPGQRGRILLTGFTDQPLDFTVKTVTSVSEAAEGSNFFRIEAEVDRPADSLRPGLEGVGKIDVDQRRLLWIWTRSVVDWVRLALWRWLP